MQNRRLQGVYIQGERQRNVAQVLVGPRPRLLAPVALRADVATTSGRRPPRRSLTDHVLLYGEWLAATALVVFAGYQVYDGPVRDWLHEREARPAQAAVISAQPPAARDIVAAGVAAENAAPVTVEPSNVAAQRTLHPELGDALPSIGDKWRRPAVAPDYLQAARDFVPAAAAPPPAAVEAAPPPVAAADPRPTHLSVPSAGIDTGVEEVFLQDGVWQVADYAAGYLHGTGVPGSGNVVMAGHQGIRGAVFATLETLKPGTDVFVETATHRFRYRVRETGNVWPSQVSVMFPTATPTLTLMTCTNWDMQRFIVVADLVDSVALPESANP